MRVSSFAKAIAAAVAAGTAAVATAVQDSAFTTGEGVTVALAVLGALGITYAVPNKQPAA
ncbi:hypothetical protein [Streptomyces sp. NBC_01506]|uniref:hypothetical protein n=1 Tax=Streptomyces sp. NBC_01506 TaxID=2903887 RepID=UPI003868C4B8